MAAAPAMSTPRAGIAGNRTAIISGFCPALPSANFVCQKQGKEIKAHAKFGTVTLELDGVRCTMSDIVLFKMHDGFVGVRFDFGSCTGTSVPLTNITHIPTSASIKAALSREVVGPQVKPAGFADFFLAVCGGHPPADFLTQFLPKFVKPVVNPMAVNNPGCFAESANMAHVLGTGCFPDFLFFELRTITNQIASIPASQYDRLVSMIPGIQNYPDYWPVPVPTPAPKSPCATVAPPTIVSRKLEDNPNPYQPSPDSSPTRSAAGVPADLNRLGEAPDPSPDRRAYAIPINPCAPGTTTTVTIPVLQPLPSTCAEVICAFGYKKIPHPERVPCADPRLCTAQDAMKCCVHGDSDVPGYVVGDRVCLHFAGCGCDNACTCTDLDPAEPLRHKEHPIPEPVLCLDYWKENIIIAVFSWLISVPLIVTYFRKVIMTESIRPATGSDADAGRSWCLSKDGGQRRTTAYVALCGSIFSAIVLFIVIHVVYFMWMFVGWYLFAGRSWHRRRDLVGVDLWKCGFTFWPLWIAMGSLLSLFMLNFYRVEFGEAETLAQRQTKIQQTMTASSAFAATMRSRA
jgi:hypothetical protein